jgi:hypothetical protein
MRSSISCKDFVCDPYPGMATMPESTPDGLMPGNGHYDLVRAVKGVIRIPPLRTESFHPLRTDALANRQALVKPQT